MQIKLNVNANYRFTKSCIKIHIWIINVLIQCDIIIIIISQMQKNESTNVNSTKKHYNPEIDMIILFDKRIITSSIFIIYIDNMSIMNNY